MHAFRARLTVTLQSGEPLAEADIAQVGKYGAHNVSADEERALRVQCHLRLGQWQQALSEPVVSNYAALAQQGGLPGGSLAPGGEDDPASGTAGPRPARSFSRTASGGTLIGSGSGTPATAAARAAAATRMPSDAYAALVAPVLTAFRTATHECGANGHNHYRAWHAWSIMNFAAAEHHAENARIERDKERQARAAAVAAATPAAGTTAVALPGADGATLAAAADGVAPASGRSRRLSRGGLSGSLSSPSMAPAAAGGAAGSTLSSHVIQQAVTAHAVAAVKGFFRSIALGRTRLKAYVLQDLLRLLTLWFSHGEASPVRAALEQGLASGAVSIEVWLQVIPQLIARINIRQPGVHKLLHQLLTQIGSVHPQALVYPLTVACKSAAVDRKTAATSIINVMRRKWPRLVEQAEMVSRELIRVAILWHEIWNSALEKASLLYFGDGNAQGMLATLLPLHEMMTNPGPQTLRESAFLQTFGRELDTAHRWLLSYKSTSRVGDLSQAWDIYYHIFRKINKMLPQMQSLELQYVSPILLAAHDLQLCVPGTYHAGSPTVRIMSFSPSIDVLSSKQKPRKVTLLGSDGRQYTFLLKGHEDLRQDERVMQLFGLVNTLLANDSEASRRDLSIRRYAVTPLSHDAGVVGWVPNCDTLHALIRDYRDSRKVLLNIEHRLMVQIAPMFDHLGVLQKVEVFRIALDNTTGQDLYKVLWLKSASSEVWLERRTNYTRSLAVMSIVGYILGLGDRHPSNLMLDRVSGKILHIDFGDWCVALPLRTPCCVLLPITRCLRLITCSPSIPASYATLALLQLRGGNDARQDPRARALPPHAYARQRDGSLRH